MYSIFRNSSLEGAPMALVFEARAILHCHFHTRLTQILASPRCGGHLHTYQQGGVLLLGAEQVRFVGFDPSCLLSCVSLAYVRPTG
jgi:hypothetical protein